MNDADRAEIKILRETIIQGVLDSDYRFHRGAGEAVLDRILVAAKRKWEKAAANAKLEEAAVLADEWFSKSVGIDIRALKQE